MGAVVTIHAPLLEVSHILLPPLRHDSGAEYDSMVSKARSVLPLRE